jgi:hypothetical protein
VVIRTDPVLRRPGCPLGTRTPHIPRPTSTTHINDHINDHINEQGATVKTRLAIATATAGICLAAFAAGPAAAAPGDGGRCAKAGTTFLREAGALVAVAQDGLLGLSLGQVVKLHTQDPTVFGGGEGSLGDWCAGLNR